MEFLDNVKENVRAFVEENTKLTVAITCTLLALLLGALIAYGMSGPEKEIVRELPDTVPYSAVDDFFPPQKNPLTEKYYFQREQESQWSGEEFDKWFTTPTEKTVDQLGKSNNRLIDELIGAAP